MQWKEISANWAEHVPTIIAQWPDLDAEAVTAVNGDQDAFLTLLTTAKGGNAVTAQVELADWLINGVAPEAA